MKREITIGLAVVAGAALLEVALVPGIILGGAAFLVPRYLTGRRGTTARRNAKAPQIDAASRELVVRQPSQLLAKLPLRRTIAKTITFRLIVTTLDFTTNYIVIGEIATAAGLSTFNLFAGPLFYFAHEAGWNYLRPSETSVTLHLPTSNLESDPTGAHHQPGAGQDDHLPNNRNDCGLHHELRGCRHRRRGDDPVSHRLRARTVRLLRP
jgi:uncharacterized membrane protein